MGVKYLAGYTGELTDVLEADDLVIALNNSPTLKQKLANDGDWTSLIVRDNAGYEIIKVLNFQGNLAIERGIDGTTSRKFPKGSCVSATPSQGLIEAIACQASCCDEVDETYGDITDNPPSPVSLEVLPNKVIGGVAGVLGEPDGFMLINGKKVPFYE